MNPTSNNTHDSGLRILESAGVCRIGFHNPDKYNAITLDMWEDLSRVITNMATDKKIRVIVLHGVGDRAFSAGADISEFSTRRSTPEQVQRYHHAVDAAQDALSSCPIPTVAAIRGICMGGGMEIAAVCDLRYADEKARFRMSAAAMGLGYSLKGVSNMTAIVGVSTAKDIFMTARRFDGQDALQMGFVNEVFSDDEFETLVEERVAAIKANAPLTLRAIKLASHHLHGEEPRPSQEAVARAIQACFDSNDYKEGQRAFREKRSPRFLGD
jgi:enoyl-CoA hydratase/carnithine racemase